MRNFISYTEYLSRHPDVSGGAVTPVARAVPAVPVRPLSVPDAPAFEAAAQAVAGPGLAARVDPVPVVESYAPEIELSKKKTRRRETPQGSGKGGVFAFFVMLLCFGIAVSCAVMMSKGLSLGHLRGSVVRYEGAPHTAYCVQMAAPGTPEEAAQIARDTRAKGGGGYIYMTDGLYLILASAYDTEAACDDVIDKLTFSKISASKYLIEIPAVSLDFTADKEAVAVIEKAYESFWQTFLGLYELSVDLDEGNVSADAARLKLGERNREIADLIRDLGTAGESCTDMAYIHIKAALTALSGQLDTLFVDMDHASQLSSDLKYAYLKLLHDFRALALELS